MDIPTLHCDVLMTTNERYAYLLLDWSSNGKRIAIDGYWIAPTRLTQVWDALPLLTLPRTDWTILPEPRTALSMHASVSQLLTAGALLNAYTVTHHYLPPGITLADIPELDPDNDRPVRPLQYSKLRKTKLLKPRLFPSGKPMGRPPGSPNKKDPPDKPTPVHRIGTRKLPDWL